LHPAGVFLQFGAAGIVSWWMVIGIVTYLMVRFHTKQEKFHSLEKYFHIGCWTYIVLSTIIPLISDNYSAGLIGGCWLGTGDNSWWQYGLFYIPVGISLMVVLPLLVHAMIIIYRVSHGATKQRDGKEARHIATYVRFVMFLIFIMINIVVIFQFKFYAIQHQNEWIAELQKELLCRVNGGTYIECLGPRPATTAIYFNDIMIAMEGILVFVFFGITQRNYELWKHLILTGVSKTKLGSRLSTIRSPPDSGYSGERSGGLRSSSNKQRSSVESKNSRNSSKSQPDPDEDENSDSKPEDKIELEVQSQNSANSKVSLETQSTETTNTTKQDE